MTEQGCLYCHPAQLLEIADLLLCHDHLGWQLLPDESLAQDRLKLFSATV
ncbi:hypothetical protein LXA23_18250 [Erwinia amylovora]|nr:hypothetical protein [Erwinia amylovora]